MTEPTELLPCPFCGHSGPLNFQDGSTHRWGVAYCAECGASAGETRREYPDVGEWHAKAIAQWNTRTPQPTHAQTGAVPLTREQVKAICLESGYETATLQERADFINGIRHAEAAHGIKGKEAGNADT